jgi:hypothetical protein
LDTQAEFMASSTIRSEEQAALEEFLKQKEISFVRDIFGYNPLSYAVQKRNFEILNLIVDYMISVNPQLMKKIKQPMK